MLRAVKRKKSGVKRLRVYSPLSTTPRNEKNGSITRNPRITRSELAEAVEISPDGVKYHLQKLTKLGRLKRAGSTRRGEWVIG